MAERVLAHVEKVVKTYAVEKSDRVEMTQVLDFHVVTKKGEFKEGDLVVFVEVDSILPDGLPPTDALELKRLKKVLDKATGDAIASTQELIDAILAKNIKPEFEFLRTKKFRIKVLEYKAIGVISQGIVFPVSILPEGVVPVEGLDVTEAIGVTKYVEDADEANTTEVEVDDDRGGFEKLLDSKLMRFEIYRDLKRKYKGAARSGKWEPWMAPKTDQVNIENIYSKLWNEFGDRPLWGITEKVEGQSMSFYTHEVPRLFGFSQRVDFGVCSKNVHMVKDDNSRYWKTIKELDLEKRLRSIKRNLMLQGEHAGGKIQGNIYGLPEHHIYLFGIFNIETQLFLTLEERLEFCREFEFEHTHVHDIGKGLLPSVQEMLAYSDAKIELVPGNVTQSEGRVWELLSDPERSFKSKSPVYLALHKK